MNIVCLKRHYESVKTNSFRRETPTVDKSILFLCEIEQKFELDQFEFEKIPPPCGVLPLRKGETNWDSYSKFLLISCQKDSLICVIHRLRPSLSKELVF